MKQTTLTQRLLSALVALCMVLSVCAPALAAGNRKRGDDHAYKRRDNNGP